MEFVNFERFEQIKLIFKFFLVFLTIPALSWWWNYIKSFFVELYEDNEDNNCCPHCHVHMPPPNITPNIPIEPYLSPSASVEIPVQISLPEKERFF